MTAINLADADSGIKVRLNVGIIRSAFTGLNFEDAEEAFKTFARTIGKQMGYDVEVTVHTFAHSSEVATIPEEQRPAIVILESWNYLDLADEAWLEPYFVSSSAGKVTSPYRLLVRDGNTLETIQNLRGKSLNVYFTANTELGLHWLRSLLHEHKLDTPDSFFGSIEYHTEPLLAILPVFFGKKDAGLIDSTNYELMAELNPQMNTLHTVAISEPLVNGVICLNRAGWSSHQFKKDLIDAMAKLHLTPAGQQILTLFKMDQLVYYQSNFLDTVRALARTSCPENATATSRFKSRTLKE